MNLNFKFTNLCGTVYNKGDLRFTPDGNTLISPVGNRITLFDLVNHTSYTLPFETRKDILHTAISPDSNLFMVVDEDGLSLLINFCKKVVLSPFNFKSKVSVMQFSPNGKYLAVDHNKYIHIWNTPKNEKQFAPFVFYNEIFGHNDKITCLDWSPDSNTILSGSRDMTVRIHSIHKDKKRMSITLAGHRDTIVGCFFGKSDKIIYTVARDGVLFVWVFKEDKPKKNESMEGWDDAEESSENVMDEEDDEEVSDQTRSQNDEEEMSAEAEDEESEEKEISSDAEDEESDEEGDEEEEEENDSDEEESEYSSQKEPTQNSSNITNIRKGKWILYKKYFFWSHNASRIKSVHFHRESSLLSVGFYNGVFGLYDLDSIQFTALHENIEGPYVLGEEREELPSIQKLSISQNQIDTVNFNSTGEWITFGISSLGQVMVWEWQSERYILNQKGHLNELKCLAYSPEGQYIATGDINGSIKVWNASSGLCSSTLDDHDSAITDIEYSKKGQFVVSSSLDGTVRAFDLIRHKCFRTFTSPVPTQFSCVTIDPDSEIVAAGSQSDFNVHVWSIQTGKLTDILEGHEGPVSSIAFNPAFPQLATASWDKTVKLWNIYTSKVAFETFKHGYDITCIQYRPDGKQLCVAALDGCLYFWNVLEGVQEGMIEGRKDINAGRGKDDARTAKNNPSSKFFTCLSYSSDGRFILAGGNSRFICLYDIENKILVKKFQTSHNRSIEGVIDYIDSREIDLGEYESEEEDYDEFKVKLTLPGVKLGNFSKRKNQLRIKTTGISFSPSGRQWACATTCGLLIYGLDDVFLFDPFMLDLSITPENIKKTLLKEEYLKALIMSLRLNESKIISNVFLSIPYQQIEIIAREIHPIYLQRFVNFIAKHMDNSPHLEFHMRWIEALFNSHGQFFKDNSPSMVSTLRHLQKSILRHKKNLDDICEENKYMMMYVQSTKRRKTLEILDE